MRKNRDNFAYVLHIRDAIEKISTYAEQHNYEYFLDHDWDQAAVMKYFEIIWEAANNTDGEFKEKHSEIEWRDMIDFRNFMIHDYVDVDMGLVWKTMTKDIPVLRKKIEKLLEEGTKIIS